MLLKYYDYLPLDVEIDINNKLIHGYTNILKKDNKFYIIDILKYLPEYVDLKYLCINYYGVQNYLKKGINKFVFIPYVLKKKTDILYENNVIISTGDDYNNFMYKINFFDGDIENAEYFEVKSLSSNYNYNKIFMINGIEHNTFGYLTEMLISNINKANKIIIYSTLSDIYNEMKEIIELSDVFKYDIEKIENDLYIVESNNIINNNLNLSLIMDLILNKQNSDDYKEYINNIKNYTLSEFMLYLMDKFSYENGDI